MRFPIYFLVAAACALTMFSGCRPEKKSILAKTFLGTGFDPELAFRRRGFTVKASKFRDGATDLVEQCYWVSWQGVVTVTGDTNAFMTVSEVVRDELNRALGAVSEDALTTMSHKLQAGQPFWGSLNHDADGARISVRVWLIPQEQPSSMSYVIYLRAADLPK